MMPRDIDPGAYPLLVKTLANADINALCGPWLREQYVIVGGHLEVAR